MVAEQRAMGNPVAGAIEKLQLDRNAMTLRLPADVIDEEDEYEEDEYDSNSDAEVHNETENSKSTKYELVGGGWWRGLERSDW